MDARAVRKNVFLNVIEHYIQTNNTKKCLLNSVQPLREPVKKKIWMDNLVFSSRFFIHIFDRYFVG